MTDTPDPKTVREIARKHLAEFLAQFPTGTAAPFFVGSHVLEAVGDLELWRTDPPAYEAWCAAVVAEIQAALFSWPDEREPLRDEFGLRINYVSTLREERPVSDTLADAQTARDRIAARPDVVSCAVVRREVGEWREDGDGRG